jgi:hypothetical protein
MHTEASPSLKLLCCCNFPRVNFLFCQTINHPSKIDDQFGIPQCSPATLESPTLKIPLWGVTTIRLVALETQDGD